MNTIQTTADTLQSIREFCEENGISRAFFYKLKSQGKAPKVTKLGSRSLITPSAKHAWLESLDQEAQ